MQSLAEERDTFWRRFDHTFGDRLASLSSMLTVTGVFFITGMTSDFGSAPYIFGLMGVVWSVWGLSGIISARKLRSLLLDHPQIVDSFLLGKKTDTSDFPRRLVHHIRRTIPRGERSRLRAALKHEDLYLWGKAHLWWAGTIAVVLAVALAVVFVVLQRTLL